MSQPPDEPQRVRVVDLDISFVSLMGLMVKAALAAIPALIILAFIGAAAWAFIAGMLGR